MPSPDPTPRPIVRLEVDYKTADRILQGLEEIAAYLRISLSSVRRYVHRWGLPAMQRPDGQYMTSVALLDAWILTVSQVQREERDRIRNQAKALHWSER